MEGLFDLVDRAVESLSADDPDVYGQAREMFLSFGGVERGRFLQYLYAIGRLRLISRLYPGTHPAAIVCAAVMQMNVASERMVGETAGLRQLRQTLWLHASFPASADLVATCWIAAGSCWPNRWKEVNKIPDFPASIMLPALLRIGREYDPQVIAQKDDEEP